MNKDFLYISTFCFDNMFDYLQKTSFRNSGHSIQKFHKLILKGLEENLSNNYIIALSSIPVTSKTHSRIFWNFNNENLKKLKLIYIPFLNFLFFKNLIEFIYTFFFVLFYRKRDLSIIVDCLKLTPSSAAFLASRIRGFNVVAIVTDIPGINIFQNTLKGRLKSFIIKSFVNLYDGYVLSSKYMNPVVNKHNKVSVVMECLVDDIISKTKNISKHKIILYSGGLFLNYGVEDLIYAFIKLKGDDLRLHLYGYGELYDVRDKYTNLDMRIIFFGTVVNSEMVQKQQEATLLVNPRYSNTLIAKYCFPGKNMEYMASGTPFLGTLLPAIPNEYHKFMYHIKDETVDGLHKVLSNIMIKNTQELNNFGNNAKEFIAKNKNKKIQASKIINLFEKI